MRIGSDTIVPTRLRGLRDAYGSWKTICISLRSGRSFLVPKCEIDVPWKTMSPSVGSSRRTIVRPSVDLPDLEQRSLTGLLRLVEDGHAASSEPGEIVASRCARLNSTSSQQRSRW